MLPPRLAPKHAVILPIYRNDDEKSKVLAYCHDLKKKLEAQSYDDQRIQVILDERDMRGGEKAWQHIKKGVPLRIEVGPRDIANNAVFVARRDQPPRSKVSYKIDEFVAKAPEILADMQSNLLKRALDYRTEHTRKIDSLDEFLAWFTPKNPDKPEIHGGFALSHWVDDPSVQAKLAELKVTVRCIPLDDDKEPGKCIFTGRPSPRRVVFGKSY